MTSDESTGWDVIDRAPWLVGAFIVAVIVIVTAIYYVETLTGWGAP